MHSQQWQQVVVDALREHIGPLAPVLVEQVVEEADLDPRAGEVERIAQFLKSLRPELPSCIDRSGFILDINKTLLLNRSAGGMQS